MSEKELDSKMDAALAHVDPDRRKFLGILLAGVAAVPLLNSASLAAQDKPASQQGKVFPKVDLKAAGENSAIKDGSTNTIKLNNQNDKTIKYWTQKDDIKAQQIKGGSSDIKGDSRTIKGENSTIKLQSTPIKGANTQIKIDNSQTIKSQAAPIKGESTAIKGETKPTPR